MITRISPLAGKLAPPSVLIDVDKRLAAYFAERPDPTVRALRVACEASAGATFLRRDGTAWTTDKDGLIAALLAAEITARCARDTGMRYLELAGQLGQPVEDRVEAPATAHLQRILAQAQAIVDAALASPS